MRYANNANEFLFGQVRGLDVDQSRNREILMDELKRDYMAADLRLSLFCSAVQSFKYESLLKPVPESFKRQDGEVDVERLQLLIRRLPRLPLCSENFEDEVSNLMVSVLTAGSHRLTQMTMESLLEKTDGQLQFTAACPHWVFQVDRSLSHNRNWDQIRADNQTFLAFHGSRFENFYSILNLGLHQHLNKVLYWVYLFIVSVGNFLMFTLTCRHLCLEREFTCQLSRAWACSTQHVEKVGVKAHSDPDCQFCPCVKSLITQLWSARVP